MLQEQKLLQRAASLKVEVPQHIHDDYAAQCWRDIAASLAPLLREHSVSADVLGEFIFERLADTPPTHPYETDYAFLRALFLPSMKAFAEAGEVEHLDVVESALTAVRKKGNKGKKVAR